MFSYIPSLLLFQAPQRQSAQWHDPTSARQPHKTERAVRYLKNRIFGIDVNCLSMNQSTKLFIVVRSHP